MSDVNFVIKLIQTTLNYLIHDINLVRMQSCKKRPHLRACSGGRISELGKIWGRRQEEKSWKSYNLGEEKHKEKMI